jgi:hypothetical protein
MTKWLMELLGEKTPTKIDSKTCIPNNDDVPRKQQPIKLKLPKKLPNLNFNSLEL